MNSSVCASMPCYRHIRRSLAATSVVAPFLAGQTESLNPLVPALTVKPGHNALRDEPAAARMKVPISKLGLLVGIEPLRHNQVEVIVSGSIRWPTENCPAGSS